MKKFFRKAFIAVFLIGSTSVAFAQQMPPIPTDPDVRIGKLENGLTYYIRHNELPENQADFYIAQKVGSILEEDNQRGLAHFLEHMCFNGLPTSWNTCVSTEPSISPVPACANIWNLSV